MLNFHILYPSDITALIIGAWIAIVGVSLLAIYTILNILNVLKPKLQRILTYICIPISIVSLIGMGLFAFNNPMILSSNQTKSFKYGNNIVKVQRFNTIQHTYSKVTYYKVKHIGVHIAKPVKVNSKDYRGLVIIDKDNGKIRNR